MRKYEIVEAVVMSVCKAFEVDDWRVLQKMHKNKTWFCARAAIVCLISSQTGCSLRETHYYFPVYKNEETCSKSTSDLHNLIKGCNDCKKKYLLSIKLMNEYYLLKPDMFLFIESKMSL